MCDQIKHSLLISNKLYKVYRELLNSYVSDFYVDNHWNKLENSWKTFFQNVEMQDIGNLMDFNLTLVNKVFPLSLLCLRKLIILHSIPREQVNTCIEKNTNELFLKFFWKNVKEKKRHEITLMSENCRSTSLRTNCIYIVDIGSGLGHLSRMLTYGYGFKVCTFEANLKLVEQAYELDNQFENILNKKKISHLGQQKIVHINKKIEIDMDTKEFYDIVKAAFKRDSDNFKFGMIGLHPCGNLGSTLLRLYNECSNAVFINIVSCCYMKLSLSPSNIMGFPLSQFSKNNDIDLSYLACEMACHSIENYARKLQNNEYGSFKVHAYRAALEQILEIIDPNLRHSQLCGVKYENELSLKTYCSRALRKVNINLPEVELSLLDKIIIKTWKQVLCFYSTRLLLAPLVESIILYDRMLYVIESNSVCTVNPVFNCIISPRNHILTANKVII